MLLSNRNLQQVFTQSGVKRNNMRQAIQSLPVLQCTNNQKRSPQSLLTTIAVTTRSSSPHRLHDLDTSKRARDSHNVFYAAPGAHRGKGVGKTPGPPNCPQQLKYNHPGDTYISARRNISHVNG